MMNEKKRKITIKVTEEEYMSLERGCKRRNLDKTNYMRYLIENDKNDLQSKKAAEAVNKISASTVTIMRNNKAPELEPIIVELKEGVKELWQCLQ